MKRTLTALTVVASLTASGAYAFEMNTTVSEYNKMLRKPMVGDLAVGVKGLLSMYNLGCERNGKIYLYSHGALETDPSDYTAHYEIIKEADGGFAITYGPAKNGNKEMPFFHAVGRCDDVLDNIPETIFYPVNSINGFTDRRSFLIDLINQGYE
jgi:hypothetical protein